MNRGTRGFTLIELLVVIGLLGLLFVALLPMITDSEAQEKRARCRAMVELTESAAEEYAAQRRMGDYPPDDYRDTTNRIKVTKGNEINTGIESFLFFVNRRDSSATRFPDRDDNLGNTDNDKAEMPIGKLDRAERLELMDPWGNPFAYFHFRGYGREQNYQLGGEVGEDAEEIQSVTAWRRGTVALNKSSFQIFSAGPDGKYNTPDDIGNFEIPQDG